MQRLVDITFGGHISSADVASWLTALGACGVVRATAADERHYLVTVRRSGAMEYLETLLARGEELGVLAWRTLAPDDPCDGSVGPETRT